MLSERIRQKFHSVYGSTPLLVRSPARIKFSGEFTDFFWGKGIAVNINREVIIAITPNFSDYCQIAFLENNELYQVSLSQAEVKKNSRLQFIQKVISLAKEQFPEIGGFDCMVGANLNECSGLGYYPTLAVALQFGIFNCFEIDYSVFDVSTICQQAELDVFNISNGILSPLVSIMASKEMALKVDCQNQAYMEAEIPLHGYKVFLLEGTECDFLSANLKIKQQLLKALTKLKNQEESIHSLRDISVDSHRQLIESLDDDQQRYVNFLIRENSRTDQIWPYIEANRIKELSSSVKERHLDIVNLYQVDAPILAELVSECWEKELCVAGTISGDTTGLCAVFIVEENKVGDFVAHAYPYITQFQDKGFQINYLTPSTAAGKI